MRGSDGAPRRYARALLDVALQGGDPQALRGELDEATRLLQASRELQQAFEHPALPTERKMKVAAALFEGKGSALLLRFLDLLLQRRRVRILPQIAAAYAALHDAHRGVVAAEAVSATPLTPGEERALLAALTARTGKQVELRARTEPALLGGLLVHMEGRTYDGSVRTRLSALRDHLAGRTN